MSTHKNLALSFLHCSTEGRSTHAEIVHQRWLLEIFLAKIDFFIYDFK